MTSLPLHPLVVHAAVVLLAAMPVLVLVSLVWKGLRNRLDWLLPVGAVIAGVCGFVAEATGKALLASMGHATELVAAHEAWGERLPWFGLAFTLLTVAWWATTSQVLQPALTDRAPWVRRRAAQVATSVLAACASVAVLVAVVLTGDSGATAVWSSQ